MAELLHSVEAPEYWPSYSTLVVRDSGADPARCAWGEDEWYDSARGERAALERGATTLVGAGNGWLTASATGSPGHHVLLEAHPGRPADDHRAWADVVETPFRSASGTAGLTHLDHDSDIVTLRLGEPGPYRVRMCRSPGESPGVYRFRLQFWPAPEQPPQWLLRSGPALGPGPNWHALSALACDLVQIVCWAPTESWTASLAGLAGELLAGADDLRQILRHATGRTPPLLTATTADGDPVDDWDATPDDLPLVLELWSEPEDPAADFRPDAFEASRRPGHAPGPFASAHAAEITAFFAGSQEDLLRELRGEGRRAGQSLPPGTGGLIPPGTGGPP
ncbi:MAG TPA: hypothetical protein VFP72_08540 [Kineosporiaceae bacterium]|nr:hypothetical protein [Kineosporiaceae bacterium]